MKRLFVLYCAVILTAASSCYASLASSYNVDISRFPAGFANDRQWVWVYSGPTTTNCLYKLTNGHIEALLVVAPPGRWILESTIWQSLDNARDNYAQVWRVYGVDQWGNREFATTDGRLFAKIYSSGGVHVLRICYKQYLSKNGLWRYDGRIPSRPKSKPKAKKAQPRELLPPVEDPV